MVKTFRESRTSLADDLQSTRSSIPDRIEHIYAKIEYKPYQSNLAMTQNLGLS
jgi:hypothetical protein